MLRRLAAASLVLATIACGPAPSIDEAAAELAAPATGAGRVAFLPPLGEAPPAADADREVSPTVRIEALPPAAPAVAAVFLPGTPTAPVRTEPPSEASTLVEADGNGARDVFVRRLR